MEGQLPAGAVGTAVGVLMWTVLNLVCACLTTWLTWVHHERLSYVACGAYFVVLGVAASLIQQLHDYCLYRDVAVAQFEHKKLDPSNPELVLASGSIGVDLALFYIRFWAHSVEAMFVLFWAAQLAQSVYGLSAKPQLKRVLRIFNNVGKGVSIGLPLVTVLSLRSPALQSHYFLFIVVADLPLMLSLAVGVVLVMCILARYVKSRKSIQQMSAGYGYGAGYGQSTSGLFTNESGTREAPMRRGIYDRWLLVRFTIASVLLAIFEVAIIINQLSAVKNNQADDVATTPDLSASRANRKILLSMPGVTPGLMMFVVFGTTKPFRQHMYRSFVPRRWQRAGAPAPPPPKDPDPAGGSRAQRKPTPSALPSVSDYCGSPGAPKEAEYDSSASDSGLGMKPDVLASRRNGMHWQQPSDELPILPILAAALSRPRPAAVRGPPLSRYSDYQGFRVDGSFLAQMRRFSQ